MGLTEGEHSAQPSFDSELECKYSSYVGGGGSMSIYDTGREFRKASSNDGGGSLARRDRSLC